MRATKTLLVAMGLAAGFGTATPAARAATSAPPAIAVVASPCAPAGSPPACTEDPVRLSGTYSKAAGVESLEVTWLAAGRPAGAPAPAKTTVAIDALSCFVTSSPSSCSWPWPAGLETAKPAVILNGSYRVTGCSTPAALACIPVKSLSPAVIAIAVAPAAPSGVTAATAASAVTVKWSPGTGPDLVGYRVTRGSDTVLTCSLPHAPAGIGSACPSPLHATDSPGPGTSVYDVVALGFGAFPGTTVASPSTAAVAMVAGTAPPASADPFVANQAPTAFGSALINLPPVQVLGPVPTLPSVAPPPPGTHQAVSARTNIPGDPGYNEKLPYGAALPGRAVLGATTKGAPGRNVIGLALFALGMLLIAVATHLWYVRQQLGDRYTGDY
ncbi:MAG: hypothetical protein ACYC1D_04550 [Acidimicrobiales bacterium]